MIAAHTSELPYCPECGADHLTLETQRGRYVRLSCDRCGNVFTVEADDVPKDEENPDPPKTNSHLSVAARYATGISPAFFWSPKLVTQSSLCPFFTSWPLNAKIAAAMATTTFPVFAGKSEM